MSLQQVVEDFVKIFIVYEEKGSSFIIKKKFKVIALAGSLFYSFLLVLSFALASFQRYSIFTNFISELSLTRFTLFPLIHDFACVTGGCVCIPSFLILRRKLSSNSRTDKLLFVATSLGLIGSISYIFLGVFSLERAGPMMIYHGIFTFLSFIGYIFGISVYCLVIFLRKRSLAKVLGFLGLTIPLLLFILGSLTSSPFVEWLAFTSILTFILPSHWYTFF